MTEEIHSLTISSNLITDSGLEHLKGIHTLKIWSNNITDSGICSLLTENNEIYLKELKIKNEKIINKDV